MDRCIVLLLLNLVSIFDVQADEKCNLKAIFKTPQKRDYDQLEIIERSNFISDDPVPNERFKNVFDVPNAGVLLRLGDFKNAIKKNNNNVNTRITLAGPNHNNYYTPVIQPYYTPVEYPWNLIYPAPKIPQYNIISSSYVPRYEIIPEVFPKQPCYRKPKILINDPIIYDRSSIQHIALPPRAREEITSSNGLNTMTLIPKIIIDSVAKKPLILEDVEPEIEAIRGTPLAIDSILPIIPVKPICKKSVLNSEQTGPVVFDEGIQNTETETTSYTTPNVEKLTACKGSKNLLPNREKQTIIEKTIRIYEEPEEIDNIDHPRVLHPVKLSNDIENVEIVGAGSVNISLTNKCPRKIEKSENAEDVELVNWLQRSLVPLINLKSNEEPKLLVSYPLVNNSNENIPVHPPIVIGAVKPKKGCCSQCTRCGKRRPTVDIDVLNVYRTPSETPPGLEAAPDNVFKPSNDKEVLSSLLPQTVSGAAEGATESIVAGSGYYENALKKANNEKPTHLALGTNCGSRPTNINTDELNVSPSITPQRIEVAPDNFYKSSNEYEMSSSLSSQTMSGDDGAIDSMISGYKISSGSGCYEDPTKRVIYKKPTEVTVVPPQVTKFTPISVPPQVFPSIWRQVSPQAEVLTNLTPEYLPPPPPLASKSKLLDLLKYLLTDILSSSEKRTCPYCLRVVKILPNYIEPPYTLSNSETDDFNLNTEKIPPIFSGPGRDEKPLQTSCPYCAKYRGEPNQLEENTS